MKALIFLILFSLNLNFSLNLYALPSHEEQLKDYKDKHKNHSYGNIKKKKSGDFKIQDTRAKRKRVIIKVLALLSVIYVVNKTRKLSLEKIKNSYNFYKKSFKEVAFKSFVQICFKHFYKFLIK